MTAEPDEEWDASQMLRTTSNSPTFGDRYVLNGYYSPSAELVFGDSEPAVEAGQVGQLETVRIDITTTGTNVR